MFAGIKERMMAAARSPNAERVLFLISFAESSFFPLPPDLLLGPMAAAEPRKWLRYALVCTIASVLGGVAGYAIGHFFREWLLQFEMFQSQLAAFQAAFACWGLLIILAKGLTPVPYKLITIASGLAAFSLPVFIVASIITRGARFLIVAWLFQRFGPQIAPVMEKRLGLVLLVVAVIVAVAIVVTIFGHGSGASVCPTWVAALPGAGAAAH
jgi:membrane protein YqaA with SNARE-associated domain